MARIFTVGPLKVKAAVRIRRCMLELAAARPLGCRSGWARGTHATGINVTNTTLSAGAVSSKLAPSAMNRVVTEDATRALATG